MSGRPPIEDDPVAIALGFVEGKTWPDDDSRPGPYYWRVRVADDLRWEVVHAHGCPRLANLPPTARKMPWFRAVGEPPEWAVQDFDWNIPCPDCLPVEP